jgi:O-methyltransferase
MDNTVHPGSRISKLPKPLQYPALLLRNFRGSLMPESEAVPSPPPPGPTPNSPEGPAEETIVRSPGSWHSHDLETFTGMARGLPGDFIEIGVWKGYAFHRIVPLAEGQGKTPHAMDSFEGMAPPGEYDGSHPEGEFDVGGVAGFRKIMEDEWHVGPERYKTWPGFIPQVLGKVPEDVRFSFALLDVDHYQPTVDALKWLWPKLAIGGVLALDDFYPGGSVDCTRAINEFLRARDDFEILSFVNYQLVVQRVAPDA